MLKKLRWRLFLLGYALVLPAFYVWIGIKELWEDETLFSVYGTLLESFKKGARL